MCTRTCSLERGAEIVRVELDEGDPLPDREAFDAIVAMGGPMSVNDEAEHPWLRARSALIAEAVGRGVPFWGACLGVQLLAASLGAAVYAGPEPEVGVLAVELTDDGAADPVFGRGSGAVLTLQWHGDTFDLPVGAVLLAGSPAYPNQAFRYDQRLRRAVPPGGVARDGDRMGAGSRVRGRPGSRPRPRCLSWSAGHFEAARAGDDRAARGLFSRWADLLPKTEHDSLHRDHHRRRGPPWAAAAFWEAALGAERRYQRPPYTALGSGHRGRCSSGRRWSPAKSGSTSNLRVDVPTPRWSGFSGSAPVSWRRSTSATGAGAAGS